MAQKEEVITMEGTIVEKLPNAMFQVELEGGKVVLGYSSGKIRQNKITIVIGDRVNIVFSPYDLTKGRITLRHQNNTGHTNVVKDKKGKR